MTHEERLSQGVIPVSALELATGWVFGHTQERVPARRAGTAPEALTELRAAIETARADRPAFVAFSGGRDSSVVLALATASARALGLPDPIPITNEFPGDAGAAETEWQTSVVRHLGLKEWIRIDASSRADLLGENGARVLDRFGVIWPPTAAANADLYARASGGVLFTGEGGDELFDSRRVTAVRRLFTRRRPTMSRVRAAAVAALPPRTRQRRRRREIASDLAWLRPAARRTAARLIARDSIEPLHFYRTAVRSLHWRAGVVGLHNVGVVAGSFGTRLVHPLRDDGFVAALGPVFGRWGALNRTAAMAALFRDLVPASVLERRSKATFNSAYFGPACRRFVEHWDGSGLDTELVDPSILRAEWSAPEPHGMTFMLLQQAWLARSGSVVAQPT